MNNNFLEYYALEKADNEKYGQPKINSQRKKTEEDEALNNISKNTKKNFEKNFIKRFHTPLTNRYQNQSYDKIDNINKINNISFPRMPIESNLNINQNQYKEKSQYEKEKDNDASYYKNLYIQTKNNLNKEKQKNEENQIINKLIILLPS